MVRCIYVNGRYQANDEATIHVEDRGFQFADSVYEVMEVRDGALVDTTRHLARLGRSLSELAIPRPMTDGGLLYVIGEVVRRNRVSNGIVYLQVSRGVGPRDFVLPPPNQRPTLICLARSIARTSIDAKAAVGISVKTLPDTRWARCDLKTVMLLPSVLAKAAAKREGASEAWFVDEQGFVTEGASSNAWIVDVPGRLITRPVGPDILAGVTRATLMDAAVRLQLEVMERPFTVAEAKAAREAFITSASAILMPVVGIDGTPIGTGHPGPIAQRLRASFHTQAEMTKL